MSARRVSGSSPNAKRPARIDPDVIPSGMVMDIAEGSEAICALQRQFKQMEACGVDVNASLIKHADLLDRCRDRGDGLHVALNFNSQKVKDELDSRVGTVESDMRRVHEEDKAADLQLRGEVNALSAVLSAGHDQLDYSIASLCSLWRGAGLRANSQTGGRALHRHDLRHGGTAPPTSAAA